MTTNDAYVPEIVVCACCLASFEGFSTDQAVNCDSTGKDLDHGLVVTCGYGSNHDLMRYTFAKGRLPEGNICDTCLTQATKEGFLVLIESYAYQLDEKPMLDRIREHFPNLTSHDLIHLSALYEKKQVNPMS